jgi:phenylacetate-coenzyme A ligase PaaK-like adenylate-forming protein
MTTTATMSMTDDMESLRARFREALAERLPRHIERLGWPTDRLAAHQRDGLRRLLTHAAAHSPFHRDRLRHVDPGHVDLADLPRLPTMTKADLMSCFDDVTTDRRLARVVVEDHLAASARTPSLLFDEFVCLASGGSSGERGVFVQRVGEYAEFGAAVLRKGMARTMAVGGPPPDGMVIGMVAAASPIHSTGFVCAIASGSVRFIAVPATLALPDIVDRLNALAPPTLMGYPTKLAQVAREQLAGRLRIAPRSVATLSEPLTEEDRETIASAFGVPVIDQFGSTEGLTGNSEPGGSVMTFATDVCLVELVDDDNRPVGVGETAAKALVTNLHNLTQPLIRYELPDRFVRHPDSPDHGFLRALVDGRSDEVFHYGAIEVHPLVIRTVMVTTPAVVEYQVHQTDNGVDVAIVVERDVDCGALERAIVEGLRRAGLRDPVALVRTVGAIARHPDTAKARRFVSRSMGSG